LDAPCGPVLYFWAGPNRGLFWHVRESPPGGER
jgi:hypothetical protein